jgi:hypothetical protein
MRTKCYFIESHILNEHDRRILQVWSGQEVGTHGDVLLELTKEQSAMLNELLEKVLNKE